MTGAGLALLGIWLTLGMIWCADEFSKVKMAIADKPYKSSMGLMEGALFVAACIGTFALCASAAGALEKPRNNAISPPAGVAE